MSYSIFICLSDILSKEKWILKNKKNLNTLRNKNISLTTDQFGFIYIMSNPSFPHLLKIGKTVSSKNRGVKQAGFQVLVGASMANVLIETGFLSNSKDEKNFNKKSFRKKIARGIFNALVEFKDKSESSIINE